MNKQSIVCIGALWCAIAAHAAGFDGMALTTNDWFDASFTALTADTSISQGATTGITRGAGSWTAVPATGTAKIIADASAGGEATCLYVEAPDEELTLTPALLQSATGLETVASEVCTDTVDALPSLDAQAQAAFTIYSDGVAAPALMGYVSGGWTNLVYAAGADTLTNAWFTLFLDFATVSNVRYVRFSVKPAAASSATILADSEGTEWFLSAVQAATTVSSVSLSGVGSCRTLSGDSLEEIPVAEVNGVSYGSLNAAIAAANDGDTVSLVRNTFDSEAIAATKSVTVALGAYNLTATSFSVASGSTLTFTGTGSITAPAITGGGSLVFSGAATLALTGSSASSIASLTADAAIALWSNGPIDISEITANVDFTFAGRIANASILTKKGTGTVTLVSVTAPAGGIVIEAGDVVINNTLSGVSPYVILDASDESTITETDGKVTTWASTVNDHSFTNETSAMTYVAAEGVFGGKKAVRTNNSQLQSDFVSANASVSVFAALHYYANSGTGGLLFYRTGANNVYIGKRNSGNNYWSALRASSTPIPLWQNSGAINENFRTHDTVLSVEGMSNAVAANNHVGGPNGDIAIAELITLSSNPSIANRKRIEAYLGTKWEISGMTTLPVSIPLTLAGGTSLDLNGLSRTFDSVAVTGSGTATIDGGALAITAPISVAAGSMLVIPYGSTYTCAAGTGANADANAGTVTLMHKAADIDGVVYDTVADAMTAYESGTLTIYEDATDVDLGTAEVSISGIVLADGVSAPTFATTLPWQTTYSEGTLTHTRVASTFVYVGPATYAAAATNFEIGGVAASDVPGTADTVQFDTDVTITTSSAEYRYEAVVVNADVALNGGNNSNYLYANSISGTGKLSLGNYARIATQSAAGTISCEVEVNAENSSTAAQLYIAAGGREFTLTGVLSGSGYLKCTRAKNTSSSYSGNVFKCSDSTGFSGTIEAVHPGGNDIGRNFVTFWPSCDLSAATIIICNYSGNHGRIFDGQSNGTVYKFGSFSGYVSPSASNVSNSHPTIEIGALNHNDTVTGDWMPHSGRNPYIRKVGTGTLTTTASNAYGYILNGGTLKVLATDTAPVTTEVSGKPVIQSSETIGEVEYTVYTLGVKKQTMVIVR